MKKSEYLRRLEEEGVETGVEIDVEEEEDREKIRRRRMDA